jgi:chromosome partitioning protein
VLGVDVHGDQHSALDLLLDTPFRDTGGERPGEAEPASDTDSRLSKVATRIETLDLVIANKSLAIYPSWEIRGKDPTAGLRRALNREELTGAYDYILMDAPPSFGPLTLNVLRATDEVVVPVPLTYLALDGCAELMRSVETVRVRFGNPELRVSMVVPMFYRPTRLAKEVLDQLRTRFPKEIAQTVVGFHVKIDEAQAQGLSIFEYAPRDPGARDMASLAEELELRRPAESAARLGGVG